MRTARLRSLAKINLDLRVLYRRPDGYHELRTVFQTISLADGIEVEYRRAPRTLLTLQANLEIPDNLILRAAERVLRAMGVTAEVRFRLKKRIPMGGGLGGGSSNAAAVLLALPVLAGVRVRDQELMELASGLGSDVPFFLLGGTALGLGRGTEVYPLPEMAAAPGLLVTPDVQVSTPEAYRALARGPGELTSAAWSRNMNSFQSFVWHGGEKCPSDRGGATCGANDFESVVFRQFPHLKSIRGKLRSLGAAAAMMSGSGSSVYGIFRSREERERARQEMAGETVHPISLVQRGRYQRMWWRQLREHVAEETWPPQSRYAR